MEASSIKHLHVLHNTIDISERNFQVDEIKYWYRVGIMLEFSECYIS